MEPVEYQRMFAAEDRHFWFRGKRAWVAAILGRHVGRSINGRVLDIGCGTGGNLRFLAQWGEATGVEKNPVALTHCRQRGLQDHVVAGSANSLPFADGQFALACALDVLYHREIDPRMALRELRRVLRPDGWLLITDSALPALAGPHDRAVWARERFTRRSLQDMLESAGFEIRRLSYANCVLFPLVLVLRLAERIRGHGRSSVGTRLPAGNSALFGALRFEAALLAAGINLPWGSSIVCLARRKPAGHPQARDEPMAARRQRTCTSAR